MLRSEAVMISVARVAALVLVFGAVAVTQAEEVKGRWRFDIQLGGIVPGGDIYTSAGNAQTLDRIEGQPEFVTDFRFSGFDANSSGKLHASLHASYGLFSGRSFETILDVGIGYYTAEITDIELSYTFDSINPYYRQRWPGCETRLARGQNGSQLDGCTWWSQDMGTELYAGTISNPTRVQSAFGPQYWSTESVEGGDLKGFPVSVNVLLRYRPTKKFNPYFGGGIGYLFVEFEESARWVEISDELEGSLVSDVTFPENRVDLNERMLAEFTGVGLDVTGDATNDRVQVLQLGHRMKRPTIETPDTPFLEARGGFELQFAPKWAFVAEAKFFWAKDDITITADGKEKFGAPIPAVTVPYDNALAGAPSTINPQAFPNGGKPAYIINGGLRQPGYNPDLPPGAQETLVGIDGQPGVYYMNGGTLKYGGWVFTAGVRYTL